MDRNTRLKMTAFSATAVLALTGCAASGGSASDGDLTWSMWVGSSEDQAAWQAIADRVHEANPDISVTLQGSPYGDYWTKLATQLGSTDPQCIVALQSLRLGQFNSAMTPLDDLIDEAGFDTSGFDPVALDAMRSDGTLYALPYDTGPALLYYNASAFEAAGAAAPQAGWTVDEFEQAAAKLAAAGTPTLANTVEDFTLENLAYSYNGAQPVAADGAIDPEDPAFVDALDWIGSLTQRGYATEADGSDSTAEDNAFITGRAAAFVGGPWNLLDFASKADFDLGVTTLPAGPDGGGTLSAGSGFGISAGCTNKEAAFEAITVMTGEAALTSLAEQGRAFPARTASQQAWVDTAADVIGVSETMTVAQANSAGMRGSGDSAAFATLLQQYGAAAVNGTAPAADTMAEIAAQLN